MPNEVSSTQRALLLSVSLTQFFTAFMGSSMNVAVEAIAAEFAVQPQQAAWTLTAFTVMSASFLLCASAIAQYFGLRRIYCYACALSALSALALAFVPSFSALIIGRALQGLILALIFCTGMALLVARIEPQRRIFAIAVSTAAVYAGLSLSPTIAGLLVDTVGWRYIFILAAIGLGLAFITALRLPDRPSPYQKSNLVDLVLSFVALALILLPLSLASEGSSYLAAGAIGLILLVIFLYRQQRCAHPLLPINLLTRNRALRLALSASVFNYLANFSLTLLLSLHLQFIAGFSAAHTGLILITQPAAMTLTSLATGRLTQYLSAHTLTVIGMGGITLAFTYFSCYLDMHTPLYCIMGAQIICGIGFGLFSAPNTSIVMSAVPQAQLALASALQALSRNFGQACSMAVATALLYHFIDALSGTTLYLYELSFSISAIFSCSALMALIGTLICLRAWLKLKPSTV